MRNILAIEMLVLSTLAGCTAAQAPNEVPTRRELVGEYEAGDGRRWCQEIRLRLDGTFSGRNCGGEHAELGSHEFTGSWSLAGSLLTFKSEGNEFGPAEIFYWHGKPAFIEVSRKKDGRVEFFSVFERRDAR